MILYAISPEVRRKTSFDSRSHFLLVVYRRCEFKLFVVTDRSEFYLILLSTYLLFFDGIHW